jgi:hypothetical protein
MKRETKEDAMKSNRASSKAVSAAGVFLLVLALVGQMVVFNPEVKAQGKGKPPKCDDVHVELRVPPEIMGDSVVTGDGAWYPAILNCDNEVNHLYSLLDGRPMAFTLLNPSDGGDFTLSTGPVTTNLGARIEDANGDPIEGGFLALEPGQSAVTEKVQFNFVHNDTRYWLSWGSSYPGASTATVTHPDPDTWVIETSPEPGNIARLRVCETSNPCKSPVDRLYFAPLRIELKRVP